MAKVLKGIATGLTLVALLRTTLEVLDLIQTGRNRSTDFEKLRLRLDVEKCRLYNWAESVGLMDVTVVDEDEDQDDETGENSLRFPRVVRYLLEDLLRLCRTAERLKDRYSYKDDDNDEAEGGKNYNRHQLRDTPAVETPGLLEELSQLPTNVVWVARDHRRFRVTIDEIKSLIDRLEQVTGPVTKVLQVQNVNLRPRYTVRETEAMALVGGVCSRDLPDVERLRRGQRRTWQRQQQQQQQQRNQQQQQRQELQQQQQQQQKRQLLIDEGENEWYYDEESSIYSNGNSSNQAASDITRWPGTRVNVARRFGNPRL